MLNLVWVRTFLTLVESRGFKAGADQLRLAQPTVSQHIRKLEEHLGARLIRRAHLGCEPTSAGLAFLPYAQSLIRLNGRAMAAVQGNHVRVGASSNIGIYLLQPHVKTFMHGLDPATFDLMIDRNPVIADKLENGEVDIAVMEWWDSRERFQAALWRREPIVLIVPPGHDLAQRTRIAKTELHGLALLGGEPGTGTGRLLSAYFPERASMPRISLQLGSTEAVKQAVKAGLGVSLVLQAAVAEEVSSGSLCAIPLAEPALEKDLFVIWADSGGRQGPAPAFVRHLLSGDQTRINP